MGLFDDLFDIFEDVGDLAFDAIEDIGELALEVAPYAAAAYFAWAALPAAATSTAAAASTAATTAGTTAGTTAASAAATTAGTTAASAAATTAGTSAFAAAKSFVSGNFGYLMAANSALEMYTGYQARKKQADSLLEYNRMLESQGRFMTSVSESRKRELGASVNFARGALLAKTGKLGVSSIAAYKSHGQLAAQASRDMASLINKSVYDQNMIKRKIASNAEKASDLTSLSANLSAFAASAIKNYTSYQMYASGFSGGTEGVAGKATETIYPDNLISSRGLA